jgi:hypothetical protein
MIFESRQAAANSAAMFAKFAAYRAVSIEPVIASRTE